MILSQFAEESGYCPGGAGAHAKPGGGVRFETKASLRLPPVRSAPAVVQPVDLVLGDRQPVTLDIDGVREGDLLLGRGRASREWDVVGPAVRAAASRSGTAVRQASLKVRSRPPTHLELRDERRRHGGFVEIVESVDRSIQTLPRTS